MALSILLVGAVIVVSVLGNGEGGGFTSPTPAGSELPECAIRSRRPFFHVLQGRADECLATMTATRTEDLSQAVTLEQIRLVYKNFCVRLPTLRQCLNDVKVASTRCLSPISHTRFKLYCDFKQMSLEVGCFQDGERMTAIHQAKELNEDTSPARPSPVDSCTNVANTNVWVDTEKDPNLNMVFEYFMLQDAKECLVKHRGGDQDTLVDAVLALWTGIMENMKCVHQGVEVLCKTIINVEYVAE